MHEGLHACSQFPWERGYSLGVCFGKISQESPEKGAFLIKTNDANSLILESGGWWGDKMPLHTLSCMTHKHFNIHSMLGYY